MIASIRYRFAEFVLSPRERLLLRRGAPIAIIPKYFDLLHFLIERRRDAVSKHTIFSNVWADVVVSDGALSQAVRVLRRTLGDDARNPRFIRTVSRHGYHFVWTEISEEIDDGRIEDETIEPRPSSMEGSTSEPLTVAFSSGASPPPSCPSDVRRSPSVDTLVTELLKLAAAGPDSLEKARDVAERLHCTGTVEAVACLTAKPGHAKALALMRDARWTVAGAGSVPLIGSPEGLAAATALVGLRLKDAWQTVANRWAGAAVAGAIGGGAAGVAGGLALLLSPTSQSQPQVVVALALIGLAAGAVGAAGIGAGLAAAEALARSRRPLALVACGAFAGTLVGAAAHLVLRVLLDTLFGLDLWEGGGAMQGLVLGSAAGISYAVATPQPPGGGIAAPRGRRRLRVVVIAGVGCALGAALLAYLNHPLVGDLVHDIARSSRGRQLVLAPLGRLVGEPGFGPLTQVLLGTFEGFAFGAALAWGLTRRPKFRSEPLD